ncbi:MAG: 3-ketoacyl-CoA thiolase [Waddliaceae bacterium]
MKKVYVAAGYNTMYFGFGRKEFNPKKPMPTFETYLKETAKGTLAQINHPEIDEGIIGSFMPGRFINQANLPGFLPFMVPELLYKPCTGIEGACGTGGRCISMAVRSVLSGISDTVFVAGFEMQNSLKAVYGADVLAGASYYSRERKEGHAYFFPGIFSNRAGAYYKKYGYEKTREAMALWYEKMIQNARLNPKAQEYHNTTKDLFSCGMTKPDPRLFVPHLNRYDCSKVTDGASSLLVLSEEGLKKCGIDKGKAIEIVALGESEGDITKDPADLTHFDTTEQAVKKVLQKSAISKDDLSLLELHDCFTITAILGFEAIGFAPKGKGPEYILQGTVPVNLSGGLSGFGHPTGASGVRQMVDLFEQLIGVAPNQAEIKTPYGMMISMGGNDKTVTAIVVKKST